MKNSICDHDFVWNGYKEGKFVYVCWLCGSKKLSEVQVEDDTFDEEFSGNEEDWTK